jgi:hypothetical protein
MRSTEEILENIRESLRIIRATMPADEEEDAYLRGQKEAYQDVLGMMT